MVRRICWSCLALLLLPTPTKAWTLARVDRVVDGDTIAVTAYIWPHVRIEGILVRLRGVDTPELRGRCPQEKAMARRAREALLNRIPPGTLVRLERVEDGKWAGRVIATVRDNRNVDLARWLIKQGYGRAYDGGRRQAWCEGVN